MVIEKVGKISPSALERLVFPFQGKNREEVIWGAQLGRDCGVVQLGRELISLTCDPITGSSFHLGLLATQVVVNDLICSGAEPVALLVTLIFPPGITENEIETIMREIDEAGKELGVSIIGGHTEISEAVNRSIIHCTGLGWIKDGYLPDVSKIEAGDYIVMTKGAGIEGTAILFSEKEKEWQNLLDEETINKGKEFWKMMSVFQEGKIALPFHPHALHDATEGGVLGAIWEACMSRGLGFEIEEGKIPVYPETRVLAQLLDLDPLKLISSGTLIIFTPQPLPLLQALQEIVPAEVIGRVVKDPTKVLIRQNGEKEEIKECPQDELWRVLQSA
ncbi:MAG: AIR synthase family protein [Atribacterota bacterium]|jgi:hydrogenase maturation factor|nr:AIR synthase family protein [Atribacterota bacterium]